MSSAHEGQSPLESNPIEFMKDNRSQLAGSLKRILATGSCGVRRMLLGSVAERTVRRATWSVLVVRPKS